MAAYYNEIDPYAAQWLRNLIAGGHIAPGDVDERSIVDVRAGDLRSYTQCHFFAGIGGWSYALRLAGWSDDRPVWTGSCPCQPLSAAGKGLGTRDARHLWPVWRDLIGNVRPLVIFGEQVASSDGLAWLDIVCADLEKARYPVWPVDLCGAGIGAPHIRQRLYFVALDDTERRGAERESGNEGREKRPSHRRGQDEGCGRLQVVHTSLVGELGYADSAGLAFGSVAKIGRGTVRFEGAALGEANPLRGVWREAEWLWHRDGKYRAIEPGTFPLVDGLPGRVEQVRAFGNAIVPQVAAEFIAACEPVIPHVSGGGR